MSGEIKTLKQPSSSKSFLEITPLEWFKCKFDTHSGIGMIICPKKSILNDDVVLFVNKDGDVRSLTIGTMKAYGGEFLGYLTTEESVTIHGSLDPDWVEPEPKLPELPKFIPPMPSDIHNFSLIPDYIPYIIAGPHRLYRAMNFPAKHRPGLRVILLHDLKNMDGEGWINIEVRNMDWRFSRYDPNQDLSIWNNHPRKVQHGVD